MLPTVHVIVIAEPSGGGVRVSARKLVDETLAQGNAEASLGTSLGSSPCHGYEVIDV